MKTINKYIISIEQKNGSTIYTVTTDTRGRALQRAILRHPNANYIHVMEVL